MILILMILIIFKTDSIDFNYFNDSDADSKYFHDFIFYLIAILTNFIILIAIQFTFLACSVTKYVKKH